MDSLQEQHILNPAYGGIPVRNRVEVCFDKIMILKRREFPSTMAIRVDESKNDLGGFKGHQSVFLRVYE
jgi:hypothetical protein